MPQAITAALISIGISAATAAAITTAIVTAVVSIGISFVSRLLFGGGGVKSETTERAIKTPIPPRVRGYGERKLFGASVLFETNTAGTTVDVWAFADRRANAVIATYLNDEVVSAPGGIVSTGADGRYGGGALRLGYNLGLPTETAFAPVIAALPGIWTTDHRGDGVVSGYLLKDAVKNKKFLEVYPQGDNVNLALVLQLQLCFDPREPAHDPDDQDTWSYSTNAALHLLHYYMVDRAYVYAMKLEPVIQYWIDAADDCDDAMALAAGGTEPRYRGCVVYDTTKLPGDIISELLACFDGWTAEDGEGRQIVYSGRFYEPTVSIGPEQIVSYRHQSFVEDEDVVNEMIVQYVSSEHDYNTVDAQEWRDEADITQRGKINSDGFSPQTPSYTQNRRLAKRSMIRRNSPNRGSVTTNFGGRTALGQRYINLELIEAGTTFFTGTVEVLGAERDYSTGGISFDWVAIGAHIDDWTPATDDGYGATVGDRVAQEPIAAPTIDAATAQLAPDGGAAQILVELDAPDRDDLTWFARWKLAADNIWNEQTYSDIDASPAVQLLVGLVPVEASVDVEAAYRVGDGRVSPWSATETVSTSTAGLAPAAPTEVTADGNVGEADVAWRNPSTANLSYVKVFRNTTSTFGTATAITGEIVGGLGEVMSITDTGLSVGTYYYWVVAYNAADIASPPGGPSSATVT